LTSFFIESEAHDCVSIIAMRIILYRSDCEKDGIIYIGEGTVESEYIYITT